MVAGRREGELTLVEGLRGSRSVSLECVCLTLNKTQGCLTDFFGFGVYDSAFGQVPAYCAEDCDFDDTLHDYSDEGREGVGLLWALGSRGRSPWRVMLRRCRGAESWESREEDAHPLRAGEGAGGVQLG